MRDRRPGSRGRGGGRCPELVQEGFVFYRINMLAQGPYRIGK
jgi:hypothetical protein